MGSLIAGCGCFFGFNRQSKETEQASFTGNYHQSTELGTEAVFNEWHSRSRIPVWFSHVPRLSLFIEAIRRNEPLYGPYTRWNDQTIRRITPLALFHVEPVGTDIDQFEGSHPFAMDQGPAYLQAWDHDRQAARTFLAKYFQPINTAPWMRTYAPEKEKQNWQATLDAAERKLRHRGISPIHSKRT